MAGNNGATTDGRAGNGQFDGPGEDNPGRPMGSPNKASWIRQQIQDTCTETAIAKLKALGESDKASDQATYWSIVGKSLPQQVHAEIGAAGSMMDEFDAALKRAGISNNGRTTLGEVPTCAPSQAT